MLTTQTPDKTIAAAYQIAKLHAATDGAFDEILTQHWFKAAWELCADFVALDYPAHEVTENVHVHPATGVVKLSHKPTSNVSFYSGGRLVAVVPPNSMLFEERTRMLGLGGFREFDERWQSAQCLPNLCCYCDLTARYQVGDTDSCDGGISAMFVQAVARVFAYIVENRGDVEMSEEILMKSGAHAFLDVVYVL